MTVKSIDGGILDLFTEYPVTNSVPGEPFVLLSGFSVYYSLNGYSWTPIGNTYSCAHEAVKARLTVQQDNSTNPFGVDDFDNVEPSGIVSYSDDFNLSDGSSPDPTKWNVTFGDPKIYSNRLTLTGLTNAVLLNLGEAPIYSSIICDIKTFMDYKNVGDDYTTYIGLGLYTSSLIGEIIIQQGISGGSYSHQIDASFRGSPLCDPVILSTEETIYLRTTYKYAPT